MDSAEIKKKRKIWKSTIISDLIELKKNKQNAVNRGKFFIYVCCLL